MDNIELDIEALIFASENSIGIEDIQQVLEITLEKMLTKEDILIYIERIKEKYASNYAIGLVEINSGYQFLTKKKHQAIINQLQIQKSKKKLSQAALETLAIIAYRQPITKLEIEQIRGVNCDYTIQKLLDRELITITGKADAIGKPLLYSTSALFMDYFGINDKSELPQLHELTEQTNTIGEVNE